MTPAAATAPPDLVAVLQRAARAVSVPKADDPSSFVLHAPLELMARVGLLEHVDPDRRDAAVAMIERLADQYEAAGDPIATPAPRSIDDPALAARRLIDALHAGDVDEVDSLSAALLPLASPAEATGLVGEAVATSLSAAGHAPIGFFLLGRVRPTLSPTLLRGALRTIAARPDWQIDWHHHLVGQGDAHLLHESIRRTPHLGSPGSDFIYPLMSQVQRRGVTTELLGPVLADRYDVLEAGRTLTRIAAWSMLHDESSHAPYGWTHALTMPQAVMALAGAGVLPRTALAVAGTFTVGFRAAHGTVELPDVIEAGEEPAATWTDVATAAALHEDAHLVKFTLACRYAADDDPRFERLYRSAAAYLVDWWGA